MEWETNNVREWEKRDQRKKNFKVIRHQKVIFYIQSKCNSVLNSKEFKLKFINYVEATIHDKMKSNQVSI